MNRKIDPQLRTMKWSAEGIKKGTIGCQNRPNKISRTTYQARIQEFIKGGGGGYISLKKSRVAK